MEAIVGLNLRIKPKGTYLREVRYKLYFILALQPFLIKVKFKVIYFIIDFYLITTPFFCFCLFCLFFFLIQGVPNLSQLNFLFSFSI
jgi:hypothetical protein